MKLKTVQQMANERGTSQQNIRNLKSINIVDCPIYALYNNEYIPVGNKKFVVDNQSLIK